MLIVLSIGLIMMPNVTVFGIDLNISCLLVFAWAKVVEHLYSLRKDWPKKQWPQLSFKGNCGHFILKRGSLILYASYFYHFVNVCFIVYT